MNVRNPHARPAQEVLQALMSGPDGLAAGQAAHRHETEGPNRLPAAPPVPALRILLHQLASLVVGLLVVAALISAALGDRLEALSIVAVLAVNTGLGFWTELRARRAMESLSAFDEGRADVRRDGRLVRVPAVDVVPGDILEVRTGQRVAADARLIDATDLRVDEAALTGESLPVSKDPTATLMADTLVADRKTMVFKGTSVVGGTAQGVVTAIGAKTEVGRIGALIGAMHEERTPLERRLDTLGRHLAWIAVAVAALVAAIGALQGEPLAVVLELGIALAVAAVPEALPVVATIALAVGLHRMARRRALVRRLPAVESLGSTTVVCTDKTRTLTSGEMSVAAVWPEPGDDVLRAAALASRTQTTAGGSDPVDHAAITAAGERGFDREAWRAAHREIGEVPFSSERQLMAVFHDVDGQTVAYVKGAPRRLLEVCDRLATPEGEIPLDDKGRRRLLDENARLASDGLRVLASASGPAAAAGEHDLRGLVCHGLFGLLDPPAPGVRDTIARLEAAGLRTIMLTGDQRLTAEAVGRSLGLRVGEGASLDGHDLDALTPDELRVRVADVGVFSRISPEHKLRIVEALRANGEIVAMLGDGVNDAPALKRADVGVAMGERGTDVARDAAAIVLGDDRFDTIAAAVEEGRVIYDNIRKFVFYLFSCNVAEVLVLLVAGLAGWPLPLLPLQILWLNMVTDTVPALALAMEPAEPAVMTRPPRRPDDALLSRAFLSRIALHGAIITAVTLSVFVLSLDRGVEQARTLAFTTLALAQIFHLGTARSDAPVLSWSRITANPYAIGAALLAVAVQATTLTVPFLTTVLQLSSPAAEDLMMAVGLSLVPAVLGQILHMRRATR